MKLIAILTVLPRLVVRGAGSLIGFLRARRRATRVFRTGLERNGLPPEVVLLLTEDFRSMVRLRPNHRDRRGG